MIWKQTREAEREYMNVHRGIKALATSLDSNT